MSKTRSNQFLSKRKNNQLNEVPEENDNKYKLKSKKYKRAGVSASGKSFLFKLFIAALVVILSLVLYKIYELYLMSRVNTPFNGYKMEPILTSNNWGSYRSGNYFGLKTAAPNSIVTGLMWFNNKMDGNSLPIRHWCDQHDRLERYGWTRHDFDNFGVQQILDRNLFIETSFIKLEGNEWRAKIKAKTRHNQKSTALPMISPVSIILYVAKENTKDHLEVVSLSDYKPNSVFQVNGVSEALGNFQISISVTKQTSNVLYRHHLATAAPLNFLKEALMNDLYMYKVDLFPEPLFVVNGEVAAQKKSEKKDNNFIAHQITFYSEVEIEMNIKYLNERSDFDYPDFESFDQELKKKIEVFDSKFEKKFQLVDKNYSVEQINFAKAALSNMLGGIGYFYGYSDVQSKYSNNPVTYGPLQLISAVPSRSFFPRGFLWDEGFHQLLINRWDPELSLKIIKSWLNLMNVDGWIPREVILGVEAKSRVPQEFIVQKDTNANPPTLFLALDDIISGKNFQDKTVLSEIFPRLEQWFNWFNTSQVGLFPSTYRWRGRDSHTRRELNPKTLTSGLDDYPRATHPSDDETHLDIRCWIAFAAGVMAKIARLINHPSELVYLGTHQFLADNQMLDELHWSEKLQMYSDRGFHSTDVKLAKVKSKDKQNGDEKERIVLTPPKYGFVGELGYVSLFPLMLNIIKPDNPKLEKVLDDLENPNLLSSPFGIRSLSKKSFYYQKFNTEVDPPYWRGPIWINMNYLILKSLHHYSLIKGPYQTRSFKLYKRLRENLISNIFSEYKRTGYIWEQYNDITGQGQGSHPFTGWSALVLLMMSEKY